MHKRREQESLEIHRQIARLLEQDPVPVFEKASANLSRWRTSRGEDALGVVYREWQLLLETLTPKQMVALLLAEDERAVRLRQSSPFAGVLSPREVWKIKRGENHAAA